MYVLGIAPAINTLPLVANPWLVVVVTVTVLPTRAMLALAFATPPTVEVPLLVAGVAGLTGTAYVKVVVVGTDTTVKAPLYSVCVAPESVTVLPTARPWAAVVVAVAVSVPPVAASLEAAARVRLDNVKAAAGLLSWMVPVAGLVGFSTTVKVKCVASVTVTVNRPLYSVSLAPPIVTL